MSNDTYKVQRAPDGVRWEVIQPSTLVLAGTFETITEAQHRAMTMNLGAMARLNAELIQALQRLTHPAADDDDLSDALRLLERIKSTQAPQQPEPLGQGLHPTIRAALAPLLGVPR